MIITITITTIATRYRSTLAAYRYGGVITVLGTVLVTVVGGIVVGMLVPTTEFEGMVVEDTFVGGIVVVDVVVLTGLVVVNTVRYRTATPWFDGSAPTEPMGTV